MSKEKILIGGAWPYANGSLHLGHIAGLLSGDIIARYFRLKGSEVLYVSGSDCHGTPISLRADKEKVKPEEIAEKYHEEFVECFDKLGFSYDVYTKTMADFHENKVKEFFRKLYSEKWLYPKKEKVCYCNTCKRFLPDRYVGGVCYTCGAPTRGDQCDACGTVIDIEKLKNRKCNICNSEPELRDTEHLFFALSKLQDRIIEMVDKNENVWRQNAIGLTRRYINEGLLDRATTRDLDWGIEIPISGYEGKKIYVWFEAVLGYITDVFKWFNDNGKGEEGALNFFGDDLKAYYVHGKDNIPFHTVILPGLLMALNIKALPTNIISSEYLTIEGKKLSTSKNWAVWVPEYLKSYDPDPLRYFLITNGPEIRDADFSWREFVERNNSELLGAYGNLVNRTIAMVTKNFGYEIPKVDKYTSDDTELLEKVKVLYAKVGEMIEKGDIKAGIKEVFEVVRDTNKYIDDQAPWKLTEQKERLGTVLNVCLEMILNLSNLLNPYIPHITKQALGFFNEEPSWEYKKAVAGNPINEPVVLVKRLDKKIVDEEVAKLGKEI